MSVVNYSVPFSPYLPPAPPAQLLPPSAPASTHFLGSGFQGFAGAAAINTLLYESPRVSSRATPTVPNRNKSQQQQQQQQQRGRGATSQAGHAPDPRDPYASYYPASRAPATSQYLPTPANRPAASSQNVRSRPPPPPQPQEANTGDWPNRPPGYTRISNTFNSAPEPNAKTSVHAVIDYDDDFDDYSYEDEEDLEPLPPGQQKSPRPQVTPIEGPIFVKNGSVPVVPLYSYNTVNNGSLVQIPILWTALSLALGVEIRGEVIRGVPCIKRFHQLFCPTAGNSYPGDQIERFIDDNKALMKRMYGEFQMSTEYGPPGGKRGKRNSDGPDPILDAEPDGGSSYFVKHRRARQSLRNNNQNSETGRVDACESKVEIVTPYWASNSAGKVRAIVNTQHFEQAIHQEVCSKTQTKRCEGDCGCEQKYKWHRLLAYDPDNDCKGIFMDWFLFPSCCVCRCAPLFAPDSDMSAPDDAPPTNNDN